MWCLSLIPREKFRQSAGISAWHTRCVRLPVSDREHLMKRILALALWLAAGTAAADLKVMVGVDPSDRESMVISLIDLGTMLSRVAGQPVRCYLSQDLGDVMRSTRTGEYEVYVAPAHVAASALPQGYALA